MARKIKVASLADSELDKEDPEERNWEPLLDPELAKDDLLVTECDAFKDFIAIYCKRHGKPEIIMQDLDTNKYQIVNVNDDLGAIAAGMNNDYDTETLNFNYQSPFVYM